MGIPCSEILGPPLQGAFRRRRRTIRPHRRRARGGRRLHRSTPRLTNRVQQQISHPPHPGPSVTTRVLYSEPTSSALLSFATVPTLASSSTSLCSPPPACPYNLRYKRAKTTAKHLVFEQAQEWRCRGWGISGCRPSSTTHLTSRSLSHEAKEVFLAALVSEGRAEWMDKGHKKCLILWLRIQDWANFLINFVKDNGLEVMTIEEIRSGTDTRGTELEGIDRSVLMRALRQLEQKGKAAIFKGTSADDEGVKFSV
ncbi:hypothetical protein SETIT_2G400000v2 [Setaria italica]|uniref:ESCRT-II complex subunit VPS25 n=1 Tax=Setaria italica TaxID=4555 RepID=A0A368Q7W5_SETIT|nr:hypothetical protein SETIT_2G400000v2 [Setaria italica]